jgi:hypothetical protein
MKKSGIELHSIISDACSACLAYELDKDGGHIERYNYRFIKKLIFDFILVMFLFIVLVVQHMNVQ